MPSYNLRQRLADHLSFCWQYYLAAVVLAAVFWGSWLVWESGRKQNLEASQWPTTVATIKRSDFQVSEYSKSPSSTISVSLRLSYQVNEKQYHTEFVATGRRSPFLQESQLAKDSEITIHYSPTDPNIVSLLPWFPQ
jgi:hypothetical protein